MDLEKIVSDSYSEEGKAVFCISIAFKNFYFLF